MAASGQIDVITQTGTISLCYFKNIYEHDSGLNSSIRSTEIIMYTWCFLINDFLQ